MTPTQHTRRRLLRLVGGTAATVIAGGAASGAAADDASAALQEQTEDQDDESADERATGEYTAVYRDAIDSVVLVSVGAGSTADSGPGGGGPGSQPQGGLGSGFVLEDGHVVTNNHVVAGAGDGDVELQFSNEEWRTASVVGTDVYSDIAVLEVDDLPDVADGLALTDTEPVIGQEVLALGNPLGLNASLSQGIVSGVDRSLPSPTGFAIPAAIQTDAPVNPGNSGGPLVDLEGEVLGIVFAGAGQTIGFAISALLVDRVVPELIETGEYDHSYIGIGVQPVGPEIAEANDLAEPTGVLVTEVVPDSPADGVLEPAGTGNTEGDVIVAIDGEEIPNQDQLSAYLALETSPGETIELEIVRDGEREAVELTLEERPEAELPQSPVPGGPGEQPPFPEP